MSEEEILEGNKLIAEFMGYKYINPKDSCDKWGWYLNEDDSISELYLKELKYHSSWSWLMSVVEKISNDPNVLDVGITFNLGCDIYFKDLEIDEVPNCWTEFEETMIGCVYQSCIKFIKWQRKRKKAKN